MIVLRALHITTRLAQAAPAVRAAPVAFTKQKVHGPLDEYNLRVQKGRIRDDPYQRKIIGSLTSLHANLASYSPPVVEAPPLELYVPKKGIARVLSFWKLSEIEVDETEENPIEGIYLYGDVGCGKTMLMDLFYDTIPEHLPKKRIHFHQFMQHLHKRSHQLKVEMAKLGAGDHDVIPILATEIALLSTILCFDEFQVTDVADAMLLRRLLMFLLLTKFGVVLFATSNRAPDDLYLNGIQRVTFIPCIKQIKRQTKVIYLNSPTDYRKVPKPMSSAYYFPKPGVKWDSKSNRLSCVKHAESWFAYFAHAQEGKDLEIETDHKLNVWGRELVVPKSVVPHVAQFTFDELCGKPLAAGDYLQLASTYKSFVVTDIPYLSTNSRDDVRRFITFLDAVYDNHGKLAVTAAAPFKDLFVEPEDLQRGNYQLYKKQQDQGAEETFENDDLVVKHGFDKSIAKKAAMFSNDEEKFAFARALLRLSQMSTQEWIEA